MPKFELVVRSHKDPEYRHLVATRESRRALDRTEDGLNINMNHEEFYSAVEEVDA